MKVSEISRLWRVPTRSTATSSRLCKLRTGKLVVVQHCIVLRASVRQRLTDLINSSVQTDSHPAWASHIPIYAMGSAPSKPIEPAKAESFSEKREDDPLTSVSCAPVSADGSLSLRNISDWEAAASASAKTRLARAILTHTHLNSALVRRDAFVADVHVFNTELDFKTNPITDQKSSGRCWLFATTNVLRYEIMKKLHLKEFQLSQVPAFPMDTVTPDDTDDSLQSYLFFWDKLNKANYYLELTIQEAGRPLDDRLISHLAGDLISDGGQWDMVVNLLEVKAHPICWDSSCTDRWFCSVIELWRGSAACIP